MMPNFEQVLSQALALPASERLQLISALANQLALSETPHPQTQAERTAAVEAICGKYANLAPSTEQFTEWKREEIEIEEQRYNRLFDQRAEKAE